MTDRNGGELPRMEFDLITLRRERNRDLKTVGVILLIVALTCVFAVVLALAVGHCWSCR